MAMADVQLAQAVMEATKLLAQWKRSTGTGF
jgi:hypothetical protein